MALPLLVNGAECGPSNPLQGLTKRFDSDRGLQQDHFGPSRAGPAREAFKTQQVRLPGYDNEAVASFFTSAPTPALAPTPFDLSTLHNALPLPLPTSSQIITASHLQQQNQHHPEQQHSQQQHLQHHSQQHKNNTALASWATDFIHVASVTPQVKPSADTALYQQGVSVPATAVHSQPYQQGPINQWATPFSAPYRLGQGLLPASAFAPVATTPVVHADQSIWDREFTSQEQSLAASLEEPVVGQTSTQVQPATRDQQDELAWTAGRLVETVKDGMATNSKFQNSQFLGLMKQLRDGAVIVDGDRMVEVQGRKEGIADTAASAVKAGAPLVTATDWASELQQENVAKAKGKERAVDVANPRALSGTSPMHGSPSVRFDLSSQGQTPRTQEDDLDAYLRKDNESYTQYWQDFHGPQGATMSGSEQTVSAEQQSWDRLQNDWDRFEATSTGIRAIDQYQFQANNPYLAGDSSRTRHHEMHMGDRAKGIYESVLELEAVVQHDPMNASAWFELGVKQQENEREQKALQALRRAVALEPGHLPAWLALGVSNTNDGNRMATYTAIWEWVTRNGRYAEAVKAYWARVGQENGEEGTAKGFERLVGCLIAMAQSVSDGEVDADLQIALAILLNTIEDYEKAQDCFKTALAVRRDDWLLYNRVGATMANSGRAEEAVHYYHRALELNPAYIRARFNLGISCINLRRYEEAAHHIFDALVLQDSDGVSDGVNPSDKRGVTSGALWDSLRTTCMHMQRMDLAALCETRDVETIARAFQQ